MRGMRHALVLLLCASCSSPTTVPDDGASGDAQPPKDGSTIDVKEGGITDAPSDAAALDGYYAFGNGGTPNKLIVFYADKTADLCFMVRLVARNNMSALTLPANWDVELAGVFKAAAACSIYYTGQAEFMQALSMSGSMSWMGQALPKTIDMVDVTLNFMPNTWAPDSQHLVTTNLPVK
jgi:hypothetical protein